MKIKTIAIDKKEATEIDVSDVMFSEKFNSYLIYVAFKNELANKRQGNSSVKTRSMVSGTTKKPWRQKGTGNARAGTNKSPLWVGGGIIFGPQKRSYRCSLNSKFKKKAMFSLLSFLLKKNQLKVIDNIELKEYNTKKINEIFSQITSKKKVLLVVESKSPYNKYLRKSANNIPWLNMVNVESLELNTLYNSQEVVFITSALKKLSEKLLNPKKKLLINDD